MSDTFAPVTPHGEIEQLFDGIWSVTGSVVFRKPPMRFSRNMTILGHDGELTLINTVRLDDAGLAALDALGEVKHIVRIAGFHGMDDPFYADRYGIGVHCVEGMVYAKGFEPSAARPDQIYYQPATWIDAESPLPVPGARLHIIPGKVPEALLHLDRDGGILVVGDALQNWARADAFFNWPARIVMKLMGFIKPHNLGPGWIKGAQPDMAAVRGLLDLDFEHVLPAHGFPVIGGAREKYRPIIEKVTRR